MIIKIVTNNKLLIQTEVYQSKDNIIMEMNN